MYVHSFFNFLNIFSKHNNYNTICIVAKEKSVALEYIMWVDISTSTSVVGLKCSCLFAHNETKYNFLDGLYRVCHTMLDIQWTFAVSMPFKQWLAILINCEKCSRLKIMSLNKLANNYFIAH